MHLVLLPAVVMWVCLRAIRATREEEVVTGNRDQLVRIS
jgi:hypothetical protein